MKEKSQNQKKPDKKEIIHKALLKGKVNPKLQFQINKAFNFKQKIEDRRKNLTALNRFENE